jgi:hypothetical protein
MVNGPSVFLRLRMLQKSQGISRQLFREKNLSRLLKVQFMIYMPTSCLPSADKYLGEIFKNFLAHINLLQRPIKVLQVKLDWFQTA